MVSAASGPGNQALRRAFVRRSRFTLPAHTYFVISAVFHYTGPAFAVLFFARVNVLGLAWLRIASAALIFAAWKRPWRYAGSLNRELRKVVLSLGLVLAGMNVSFYVAISKLPLGTVATVEFSAPIGIAAAGTRTRRNAFALILAALGVYLLTHLSFRGEWPGYLFAFANCFFFALYVLLGHRAAKGGGTAGIECLSASMSVALLVVTPVAMAFIGPAIRQPILLLAGAGVGVCSSVIPYVCDQLAMARLKRSALALLLFLLPTVASVMGALILRQIPRATEMTGIFMVMAGVGLQRAGTR